MEEDTPAGCLAGVAGTGLVLVQQESLHRGVERHKQTSLVCQIKVDRMLGETEVGLERVLCRKIPDGRVPEALLVCTWCGGCRGWLVSQRVAQVPLASGLRESCRPLKSSSLLQGAGQHLREEILGSWMVTSPLVLLLFPLILVAPVVVDEVEVFFSAASVSHLEDLGCFV